MVKVGATPVGGGVMPIALLSLVMTPKKAATQVGSAGSFWSKPILLPLEQTVYTTPPRARAILLLFLGTTQVHLNNPVQVSERVEEWLEHLNIEMKETLTCLLQECLSGQIDYERYPSQVAN